ncbi:hypothetical protein DFH28DRAFT_1069837 [Melampsora americana]|nr:hypothetical protein DFH28DRAFT_1069837 [Melampsora americana]
MYSPVRILRECPWYEELEPAFRDRPSARPLATRDSLGNHVHRTKPLTQSNQDNIPSPTESTFPNEVWDATPPREERECSIDPGLWDENTSSQERGTPSIPATKKSARVVTPSIGPSKRPRIKESPSTFEVKSKESPQTSFNINNLASCLPTKEEREASEIRAALTQQNISLNVTAAMSQMITSTRANELATKQSIALAEMNVKLRLARSNLTLELLRGGMDPQSAEAFALRQLPDVEVSHIAQTQPVADVQPSASLQSGSQPQPRPDSQL